jgi:hypothetical protein
MMLVEATNFSDLDTLSGFTVAKREFLLEE